MFDGAYFDILKRLVNPSCPVSGARLGLMKESRNGPDETERCCPKNRDSEVMFVVGSPVGTV